MGWEDIVGRQEGIVNFDRRLIEAIGQTSVAVIGTGGNGAVLDHLLRVGYRRFRIVDFDLRFGEGISVEAELMDLAEEDGIITRSGAWYRYGSERIGQGRENARAWLLENKAARDSIRAHLMAKDGPAAPAPSLEPTSDVVAEA